MPGTVREWRAVAVVALVVAGCGGPAPAVESARPDFDDKTGGRSAPITITVADSQLLGKPSNLPLTEFARQVASRSGGSMAVTIAADKEGDAVPASTDTAIIEGVRTGTFAMAVVPARAWSDAGVTSLRALQAPFLIESDARAAAVAEDEVLTAQLLEGLHGSGVTGLVLYPEGLRHVFGFGAPILTPADLDGAPIRTIRTADTDAIIRALGGVPVEADGDTVTSRIADGTLRGAESAFALVESFPRLPVATGNLVPYAKMDSLVVNDGFWASLTDEQRAILQDAAVATRAWAIANLVPDPEAGAAYCDKGGSVVLADPGSIDQLRAATDGIVADLAQDPATDALMSTIAAAGTDHPPAPVEACEAPIELTIHPEGGDLPDGIYRIEYTDEYLEGWGVTDVYWQHGVWTYRLEDGHWTMDQRSSDTIDHDVGIYEVRGRDLYWRWDEEPGQPIEHLTWAASRNGNLTFTAAAGTPESWTWGQTLKRVGPLPE